MTSILHVSKTASGGRFIGFQIPHLVAAGLDIHLALPGNGLLEQMAREAGATVHNVPELSSSLPSAGNALARLASAIKADIVHTHFVASTFAARLARKRGRWDFPVFFQVPGPPHLERGWSRELEIRTAGRHDHWGPACQWSFDRYLQSGVSANRVHLTYYGKNLKDYTSTTSARELKHALRIQETRYVAVMVAHVYPPRRGQRRGIKGHEDFIDAVSLVQKARPELLGLIVGGPRPGAERYFKDLQQRAESAGADIRFLGPRTDIPSIYNAAHLAVHPSLSENLGGAGESLLMGVPTITTNVGGFKDIVRPGISGLMVRPQNPNELAEAIQHAMNNRDRLTEMAQVGRGFVRAVGDAATNAGNVLSVYRRMMK